MNNGLFINEVGTLWGGMSGPDEHSNDEKLHLSVDTMEKSQIAGILESSEKSEKQALVPPEYNGAYEPFQHKSEIDHCIQMDTFEDIHKKLVELLKMLGHTQQEMKKRCGHLRDKRIYRQNILTRRRPKVGMMEALFSSSRSMHISAKQPKEDESLFYETVGNCMTISRSRSEIEIQQDWLPSSLTLFPNYDLLILTPDTKGSRRPKEEYRIVILLSKKEALRMPHKDFKLDNYFLPYAICLLQDSLLKEHDLGKRINMIVIPHEHYSVSFNDPYLDLKSRRFSFYFSINFFSPPPYEEKDTSKFVLVACIVMPTHEIQMRIKFRPPTKKGVLKKAGLWVNPTSLRLSLFRSTVMNMAEAAEKKSEIMRNNAYVSKQYKRENPHLDLHLSNEDTMDEKIELLRTLNIM